MTAKFCSSCARILVEQRRWGALGANERKVLGRTHARHYGNGICQTCATWRTRRKVDELDIAYDGGWVRDGLILRPTAPRRGARA